MGTVVAEQFFQNTNVLIIGCGDIGIPLGQQLVADGARVWGLRRNPQQLPDFIQPLAADVTDAASLSVVAQMPFDYVVMTLTPAGFSERGYRDIFIDGVGNILTQLQTKPQPQPQPQPQQQTNLKRIVHVSSTSVYHQSSGEWVDEESATEPSTFSGRALLEAEQLLFASGVPTTVVRFAGIYGPGRRRLIEQVRAGKGCPQSPPLYTNRIHRDDCVGVLKHLLQLDHTGELLESLYIGVDSSPVSMWEIKQWLASQMGVTLNEQAEPEMNRRNSKRCSNRRLLACGYQLKYPDYQSGYGALLS